MLSLFSYNDFRKFLKDFYHQEKSERSLTLEKFSQKAGIRSPNFLKLVIDGQKNLTVANIHKFAKAMKLNFSEEECFEALVFLNQARTSEERVYYGARLKRLRLNVASDLKSADVPALLQKWYFPAIVVLLENRLIDSSLLDVAAKIGVPQETVQHAVQVLKQAGVIQVKDEKYVIIGRHLELKDKRKASEIHRKYIDDQIQLSQRALQSLWARRSKFQSQTFTVSQAMVPHYFGRVDEFLRSLAAESDADPFEEVIQCNVQMFPLGDLRPTRT